jgi:hypothetical protein
LEMFIHDLYVNIYSNEYLNWINNNNFIYGNDSNFMDHLKFHLNDDDIIDHILYGYGDY